MAFEEIYRVMNNAAKLSEEKAFRFAVDAQVRQLVIDLNTRDQLGKFGIDSDGDSLGRYRPFTVSVRSSLGLQTDHIDFKVTGDYWASWTVENNGQEITITTDRERFSELVNELGFSEKHVGLTEENLNKLAAVMLMKYQRYTVKTLGV